MPTHAVDSDMFKLLLAGGRPSSEAGERKADCVAVGVVFHLDSLLFRRRL